MRALRVLAPAAALILFSPLLASAHGSSVTMTEDVGAYHVTFYTFDQIMLQETVRLAWNVTSASTHERVAVQDPRVEVSRFDGGGAIANRTEETLQQTKAGFVFGDITMGPPGKIRFVLPLAGANATFEQPVCDFDANNHVVCPGKELPMPGWQVPVALGAAGLACAGRRPRQKRGRPKGP